MPKILVLYHYYSPDDANNSEQCAGLAESLAVEHKVIVWPSNRQSHLGRQATAAGTARVSYPTAIETINGVKVHRVWRPGLDLRSFFGRMFLSIWMQKSWAWRLLTNSAFQPDIIILASDPIFSLGMATLLKFLRPQAKIVHWCLELYPEAAVAEGLTSAGNPLLKILGAGLKAAYPKCDLVAVQGPCMGEKLERYGTSKSTPEIPLTPPSPSTDSAKLTVRGEGDRVKPRVAVLTSWAREERTAPLPLDVTERRALFGHSPLALLYSGSMGRAHDFYLMLKLARITRKSATFAFSARGSRLAELNKAVNPEDYNVRFVPFADRDRLSARLASPDVHIVSLRPEWTGLIVPSKFFGALAVGRPVVFEGSEKSSIARWIEEYQVGWVLKADNLDETAEELIKFTENDKKKAAMFKKCCEVYQTHFSKKAVLGKWNNELGMLLAENR